MQADEVRPELIVILSDNMPDTDGLTLLREVKYGNAAGLCRQRYRRGDTGTLHSARRRSISPDALDRSAIEADLLIVEGNLSSLRDQVARTADTDRERLTIELHRLEREQRVLQAKLQALGEMMC